MNKFCVALLGLSVLAGTGRAADVNTKVTRAFGSLESVSADAAKTRAQAWLKEIGKDDAATLQKVETIWKQEIPVLDRLTQLFVAVNPDAAKMIAVARDFGGPAPVGVPAILKDSKQSAFFRNNLGLAYARLLSNRNVHDECLETLKLFQPEHVVDPAAYLFHRAVSEHALLQKEEATRTITRLGDDVLTAPERYRTVGALMLLDMATWKEKDLAQIGRKMNIIKDRLDIARGGPKTQQIQKEVVLRLDELIKEMENKAKSQGQGQGSQPNGGSCPGGQPGQGPPQGNNPSSPATESGITNAGGKGTVDKAAVSKLVSEWGRLPPREREKALQELTMGMSPRYREAIENYFRNLASAQSRK